MAAGCASRAAAVWWLVWSIRGQKARGFANISLAPQRISSWLSQGGQRIRYTNFPRVVDFENTRQNLSILKIVPVWPGHLLTASSTRDAVFPWNSITAGCHAGMLVSWQRFFSCFLRFKTCFSSSNLPIPVLSTFWRKISLLEKWNSLHSLASPCDDVCSFKERTQEPENKCLVPFLIFPAPPPPPHPTRKGLLFQQVRDRICERIWTVNF